MPPENFNFVLAINLLNLLLIIPIIRTTEEQHETLLHKKPDRQN